MTVTKMYVFLGTLLAIATVGFVIGMVITSCDPLGIQVTRTEDQPDPTEQAPAMPLVIEDCLSRRLGLCEARRLIDTETGCITVLAYNVDSIGGAVGIAISCPWDGGDE